MKKYLLFIALLQMAPCLKAQKWLWAGGGKGFIYSDTYVATDIKGNCYTTGAYESNTVKFGSTTLSQSSGNPTTYLVKYNSNGNLIWAVQAINGINSSNFSTGISADLHGNIYITGQFGGTVTFGSKIIGGNGVFVAKYDSNGNVIWVKQGNHLNSYNLFEPKVTADRKGNAIIAGSFQDTLVFGTDTVLSDIFTNVYVIKYDSLGNVKWAKQSVGNGIFPYVYINSIASDKMGNVLIVGEFEDSIRFGPQLISNNINGGTYVVKYDSSGNVKWARQSAISSAPAIGYTVTTDNLGKVYVGGEFDHDITFGSLTITKVSGSTENIFLVKFDTNGTPLWLEQSAGSGFSTAYSLCADAIGFIYLTAYYYQQGFTLGGANLPYSSESVDVLIKLDGSGNAVCSSPIESAMVVDPMYGSVDTGGKFINVGGWMPDTIYCGDTLIGYNTFAARWLSCCSGLSIVGNTAICKGLLDTLTLLGGIGTYYWSNGDTTSTITVSPANTTKYYVSINEGTCFSTDTSLVIIKPLPNIILGGDTAICLGSAGYVTARGGTSYLWSTGSTTSSISINPVTTTTYSVQVTYNGCKKDTSITLPVILPPNGVIQCPFSVCPDSSITLSGFGGTSYLWSTGATTTSIIVNPLTPITYSVIVTKNGCSDTVSKVISIRTTPSVRACCNTTIVLGQVISLSSLDTGVIAWAPGSGLSCTNCPNPIASPSQTTTYTLTVVNDSGCASQDFVTIDVTCGEVFVPNAFSPNGDEQNDVLYVRGPCIQSIYFNIYDRWGNRVFESGNMNDGWDGKYKGQPMNPGTYIYYLNATMIDGSTIEKKGNVALIR